MGTVCVAVIGFLVLVVWFFSPGAPTDASRIESVLRETVTTNERAKTVVEVVLRMRAIDTTGSPIDFKAAYLDHLRAWESMAEVERQAMALKSKGDPDGTSVEALVRGFLADPLSEASEMGDSQSQLQESYRAASHDIIVTFKRVEGFAASRGAKSPRK